MRFIHPPNKIIRQAAGCCFIVDHRSRLRIIAIDTAAKTADPEHAVTVLMDECDPATIPPSITLFRYRLSAIQKRSAQFPGIGRIVAKAGEGTPLPIHGVQPIAQRADPEITPRIFEKRQYLVVDQAGWISRIVQVANKCLRLGIKTVKATLNAQGCRYIRFAGTHPERSLLVFIKHPCLVTTQAGRISGIMQVASEYA